MKDERYHYTIFAYILSTTSRYGNIVNMILQKEEVVLREIAKAVPHKDIGSPEIETVLTTMKRVLAAQHDGVALAAPQIGISLRIFVIAGKVFAETDDKGVWQKPYPPDVVCINPEIVKHSREKKWTPEGCLSVRNIFGEVKRHARATITYYDEHGKKQERGGSGLLAQIFQHEIDHLDGKLFIDSARDLEEILPESHE